MLTYFPKPYTNESFYSIISRYHTHANGLSMSASLNELFKIKHKILNIEFPSGIKDIVSQIDVPSVISSEYLIENHTTFPYYRAFLKKEDQMQMSREIELDASMQPIMKLGLISGDIKLKSKLFYCPVCAKELLEIFGEAYWNRMHQLQGYTVCPTHHVLLQGVPYSVTGRKPLLSLSSHLLQNDIGEIIIVDKDCLEVKFAKEIEWFITNKPRTSAEFIYSQYNEYLKSEGLVSQRGNLFRTQKILKRFSEHYPQDFLKQFNSEIAIDNCQNWIGKMLNGKSMHPLRHILFILFLCESLEDFFKEKFTYLPFGTGPWKCLNPVVSHYNSYCVTHIELEPNANSKRLDGVFKCDCGFHYVRSEPQTMKDLNNDVFNIKRIRQFGEKWDNTLIQMVQQKKSLYYMGDCLKVSDTKIKREAQRLKLHPYWSNTRRNRKTEKRENKRDYRGELLEYLKRNSEATRKEISEQIPAVYWRLLSHDKEWFGEHMPKPVVIDYKNEQKWVMKDRELLEKIKGVLKGWDNCEENPIKITEAAIARRVLNKHALFGRYRARYPMTNEFVQSVLESPEDYIKRRVQRIIEKQGNSFTSINQIIKVTGICSGSAYKIKDYLESLLFNNKV